MAIEPIELVILGATGAVGRTLLQVLEEREFPVKRLRLLAGEASAGTELEFQGEPIVAQKVSEAGFQGAQVAIFAAGVEAARTWAPRAVAQGCAVVDLSGAFGLEADVALVVPEVNPGALVRWRERRIVASPSSGAVQLALALKPIEDAAGIEHVIVATYESVSSAGHQAVEQLEREAQALMNGVEPPEPKRIPHRIAFNIVPGIGAIGPDGVSEAEERLVAETRKLLGRPDLAIAATSVRVPVFYGQGQAVHLRTRKALGAEQARELLRRAPGVKLIDSPAENVYPMPMLAVNDDSALVGRVREDRSRENGLALFVVADVLRKGAAVNAVQLVELLLQGPM